MNRENVSDELLKLFKSIKKSIRRNFEEQFKELNLTAPQGRLVSILAHKGSMKISDISKCMGLSNSTVSSIIDRLEKQGYVQRIKNEKDKRIVMVDLTSAFKKIAEDKFKAGGANLDAIIHTANEDEIEKIFTGLETLDRLLKE
jgi:DNA-binding MarR family transcriptional regulator